MRALVARLRATRRAATRVTGTRRRCFALIAIALVPFALVLVPAIWLVHHVYFDRSGLPDLEPFIRFEPPDDRRRLRRARHGPDRAGARVPPGRDLRRGAADPAPGDPRRRGQALLLPFRRGLPCAAAGDPEDGRALR